MADKQELIELHEKLLNRKCYTMADVLQSKDIDGSGTNSQTLLANLKESPLVKALSRKHSASTDTTAGINELSSIVLEAAAPEAIGRSLVRVIETQKESIKVRLPKRGKAVASSRAKQSTSVGERNAFVTLTPDKEIEASDEWDLNYLEDADWDVASREASELARSYLEKETAVHIAALAAITNANLATGVQISAGTPGTLKYDDLANLWGAVKSENFTPNVIAMHTDQMTDLFKDPDFKNQLILGEFLDFDRGMFGKTILGTQLMASTLMTKANVYCLDSDIVELFALRRDRLSNTYELPKDKITGMSISSRYDEKTGRSKGFARMVNA